MRFKWCVCSLFVFVSMLNGAFAESIDLGRGPVPLVVPSNYDESKPAPLIVLLHGYTASGAAQNAYWKLSGLADTYGFLFIAPDGTREKTEAKSRFWNATEACCDFQKSEVDDSGYILGLINEVKKQYSVDANRVYVTGHSNGGFMSHRLAQDHPDTIAAIVALNGAAPNTLKGPKPKRPVHILHVHGTEDELNAYEGGDVFGVRYPGPEETVKKWAEYAWGTSEMSKVSERLDLDAKLEGAETSITRYANGSVELWTIEGGGHVPAFTKDWGKLIVEWMLAHPKEGK